MVRKGNKDLCKGRKLACDESFLEWDPPNGWEEFSSRGIVMKDRQRNNTCIEYFTSERKFYDNNYSLSQQVNDRLQVYVQPKSKLRV